MFDYRENELLNLTKNFSNFDEIYFHCKNCKIHVSSIVVLLNDHDIAFCAETA